MRFWLAAALVVMCGPALALPLHPTGRAVVTQAVEAAIRPGFAAYADETAALQDVVATRCGIDEAGLEAIRAQFKAVVLSWSRIELYQIGPLTEANRSEKILFWPDRKGIALKQVQAILAGPDWDAFDAETLKAKSVAVQGLGALEFVLFGTGSDRLATIESDFRCNYALAISTLLKGTAAEMKAEWDDADGISARLISPEATDAEFRSEDEVKQALVGLLAHGIETIRDQRILPFLGREGEAAKPKSALFWRSGMTLPAIVANFEGLETLFEKSEVGAYTPTEDFRIGEEAMAAFAGIKASAAGVVDPVEAALADPKQKLAIGEIVASSQTLGKLLGEELPAALGLSVGFSSLDGD
ncbi:imelysin family protein [Devosia sp.]|uniref:imelysin family protein n=1 Tax=Devosia sp. TaxID=1871048 RepID=UPI003BADA466